MSTRGKIAVLGILMIFLGIALQPLLLIGFILLMLAGAMWAFSPKTEKLEQAKLTIDCKYFSNDKCTEKPNLANPETSCTNPNEDTCCQLCQQKENCSIGCEIPVPASNIQKAKKVSITQKNVTEDHENAQELKKQLDEHKNELDQVYRSYGQLEKTTEDLKEELERKEETVKMLRRQLKTQRAKTRKTMESSDKQENKGPIVSQVTYHVDSAVYNYIVTHGGTISLASAAQELGITVQELKNTIEKLKKAGRLTAT